MSAKLISSKALIDDATKLQRAARRLQALGHDDLFQDITKLTDNVTLFARNHDVVLDGMTQMIKENNSIAGRLLGLATLIIGGLIVGIVFLI